MKYTLKKKKKEIWQENMANAKKKTHSQYYSSHDIRQYDNRLLSHLLNVDFSDNIYVKPVIPMLHIL